MTAPSIRHRDRSRITRLGARGWRLLTGPLRFLRALMRVPRSFRERIFVMGRGSDTGNVSPLGE